MKNKERINIYRLNTVSECDDIGFPRCDDSTCYRTDFPACTEYNCYESHVLCTSYCDQDLCRGVFQCSDNHTIFLSQFCDGIVDCLDGSDEITNQPGLKCGECVLPQSNLYDDVAHCDNNTDLLVAERNQFFECFNSNRLLIAFEKVCDGMYDCYDLSDECLCDAYFDNEMCTNIFEDIPCFDDENSNPFRRLSRALDHAFTGESKSRFVECRTKLNDSILALACDGRPECSDFSDECHCSNQSPGFCNDSCHSYFHMGDRFCDGMQDSAWQYINKSDCPQGFDELFCPKRFKCNATGKVSIDVLQVCDGVTDCDDNSDENNCSTATKKLSRVFSSDTEMIANQAIKSAFWVMGILVIIGNSYVISTSIKLLRTKQTHDNIKFQHFIILNISIADFIMGIYLITIAFYDASFSGIYGAVDNEWRSSLKCSIIGSLAIISSETSCFLMVVLTGFRFKNIIKPVESLNASLRLWKIYITTAWLFSFCLSVAPMLPLTSHYFLHSFSYSSPFQNGTWYATTIEKFACRLSALSNKTIKFTGNKFQSLETFAASSFPNNASMDLFGYYGETSVCMPRFYVAYGESSWEFTLAIITLNFLSFIYIAVSYFIIYKHSTASSANLEINRPQIQATKMQKRIARIIATDFFCWIPVCVMAYVRLGVEFSDIIYQISAVVLLPINSAMNPIILSPFFDKLIDLCRPTLSKLKIVCGVKEKV